MNSDSTYQSTLFWSDQHIYLTKKYINSSPFQLTLQLCCLQVRDIIDIVHIHKIMSLNRKTFDWDDWIFLSCLQTKLTPTSLLTPHLGNLFSTDCFVPFFSFEKPEAFSKWSCFWHCYCRSIWFFFGRDSGLQICWGVGWEEGVAEEPQCKNIVDVIQDQQCD